MVKRRDFKIENPLPLGTQRGRAEAAGELIWRYIKARTRYPERPLRIVSGWQQMAAPGRRYSFRKCLRFSMRTMAVCVAPASMAFLYHSNAFAASGSAFFFSILPK